SDTRFMVKILESLGATAKFEDGTVTIHAQKIKGYANYELVRKMRGSICIAGPLLARLRKARISLPGGCIIGARPINLHLKGFASLGAKIKIEGGYVDATAKKLVGNSMFLGGRAGPTVLGTANVMMAATLGDGITVIEHAACEPEVVDLANFLNAMGASIEGAGSHRIRIKGVRTLEGCAYDVIPDRIEAATLLMAGAITGGEVTVKNVDPTHLEAVFDKFREAGIGYTRNCKVVTASGCRRPREVEIATLPFPGFPTDLQAQMMSLMALGEGASVFTDAIYPDRLNHVAELKRMGARILRVNNTCVIIGQEKLQGAPVMASDLRAGAALVMAGLAAEGETEVRRIYHI